MPPKEDLEVESLLKELWSRDGGYVGSASWWAQMVKPVKDH